MSRSAIFSILLLVLAASQSYAQRVTAGATKQSDQARPKAIDSWPPSPENYFNETLVVRVLPGLTPEAQRTSAFRVFLSEPLVIPKDKDLIITSVSFDGHAVFTESPSIKTYLFAASEALKPELVDQYEGGYAVSHFAKELARILNPTKFTSSESMKQEEIENLKGLFNAPNETIDPIQNSNDSWNPGRRVIAGSTLYLATGVITEPDLFKKISLKPQSWTDAFAYVEIQGHLIPNSPLVQSKDVIALLQSGRIQETLLRKAKEQLSSELSSELKKELANELKDLANQIEELVARFEKLKTATPQN